jgi:hypothetical protein
MLAPIFSFIYQFIFVLTLHPMHVSVTDILFDQKEKQLEITIRVFADDLEQSLKKTLNKPDLDILKTQKTSIDDIMRTYFADHFSVSLDDRVQTSNYLGHEIEEGTFVFYVEVAKIKKWQSIKVRNQLLMETFSDQSNLVNVTVNDDVKSLRLTKSADAGILTF